jgi:hypothetical protein
MFAHVVTAISAASSTNLGSGTAHTAEYKSGKLQETDPVSTITVMNNFDKGVKSGAWITVKTCNGLWLLDDARCADLQ